MARQVKATTLPAYILEKFARRSVAMNLLMIVAGSFLIAASAQISVPMFPVPMTLQPLAVLLVGAALGSRRGFAAAVLYLLEGASGLPVFASGRGGIAVLVGPTAGYLYAFPFAAAISGLFAERAWIGSFARTVTGMSLALGLILLSGWSWLAFVWNAGASGAFATGVAPFVAGDIVKVILAATLLPYLQSWIDRTHE